MRYSICLLLMFCLMLVSCNGKDEKPLAKVVFNEFVSSNDGVSIDEEGQTEDWLELANNSDVDINLKGYSISENSDLEDPDERFLLPDLVIKANSVLVFWADDDEDGDLHLPFKLSSSGETLSLYDDTGELIDSLDLPALETDQAYARFPSATGKFSICRYTSFLADNGEKCEPASISSIDDDVSFETFTEAQWPKLTPDTLGINELSLFPAGFIEVKNFGTTTINLSNFTILATAYTPNSSVPDFNELNALPLPDLDLVAGELHIIDVSSGFLQSINNQEFREGVVSLFYKDGTNAADLIDFVPFMHWPDDNVLARSSIAPHRFQFCQNATPNIEGNCTVLPSRFVGNRLRALYTPEDFSALAAGNGTVNIESVKFVIDLENKNAVHLLSSESWPLHYSFVREIIDVDPALNRCDASENNQFNNGWFQFSSANYSSSSNRRYHLGTLSKHSNANLNNVEFTFGDAILGSQMRDVFYTLAQLIRSPFDWSLRPQDANQITKAQSVEGELPIVSPKAPFKDLVFQGLAPGLAYGTLTFVETQNLSNTTLGNRVIVITNDVPNDIDLVGGLITETFQTPLAHVNILSQSRSTPNMALPNASKDPVFEALLGKLVRLEVTAGGYTIAEANLTEAQDFWESQTQQSPILIPRLDALTAGLIDLDDASFNDLPTIGAKAAQLAELFKVPEFSAACNEGVDFDYPVGAFAIPMSYYLNHFSNSGAEVFAAELMNNDLLFSDAAFRKSSLVSLRQMFMTHPVDADLLSLVEEWIEPRYGDDRVRFRSSSNTEDLEDFNGAGLYDSISAELGSDSRPVDVAIKTVWASLWNLRAFEERDYANVDQSSVAMGILVHAAFRNERANGVAVGRNILNPIRGDQFYFNTQAGEASVTNPAPGIITEQLVYQWPPRTPRLTYQSNSSLVSGPVLDETEVRALACAVDAMQEHFKGILDPSNEDRLFTMETEFKFLGAERRLLLKQARPYPLRRSGIPNDCRDF